MNRLFTILSYLFLLEEVENDVSKGSTINVVILLLLAFICIAIFIIASKSDDD